jgi:signal peptidase II|tara:strand:- start:1711 stop:2193 length:483 start_codon:yes stop_codon:yes gene_type:complete
MINKNRNISITILITVSILLDQLSKFLIRQNVDQYSEIKLIGDYFILTNVENSGAFLGMGSDFSPFIKTVFLLILPIIVLICIMIYVYRDKQIDKISLIGFCLIIGGGIANIYDRILYGSVTDFLFIDLGGIFKTGIFNIADLSVTTGMILILLMSFRSK